MSASHLFSTPSARALLAGCTAAGAGREQHSPILTHTRFSTQIVCSECCSARNGSNNNNNNNNNNTIFSLSIPRLVSAIHRDFSDFSISSYSPSVASPPLFLCEHSVDALHSTMAAFSPSLGSSSEASAAAADDGGAGIAAFSFSAAIAREPFQRLRLSVARFSDFRLVTSSADENDDEGDDSHELTDNNNIFVLILWAAADDVALRTALDVEIVPVLLENNINTNSDNGDSTDCFLGQVVRRRRSNHTTSDGDPDDELSSLFAFSLSSYNFLLENLTIIVDAINRNRYFSSTVNENDTHEQQQPQRAQLKKIVIDGVCASSLRFFLERQAYIINKQIRNDSSFSSSSSSCSPHESHLQPLLFPHQRRAVDFALERDGVALLGDPCGAGKTLEALTVIDVLWQRFLNNVHNHEDEDDQEGDEFQTSDFENFNNNDNNNDNDNDSRAATTEKKMKPNNNPFPLLIVCPATARRAIWATAIETHLRLLPASIHVISDSSDAPGDDEDEDGDDDVDGDEEDDFHIHHDYSTSSTSAVTIISYSMLVRLFDTHFSEAAFSASSRRRRFNSIIVDESHVLRCSPLSSSFSQQTQCCSKLISQIMSSSSSAQHQQRGHCLLVSGTPMQKNSALDIFLQAELLHPGILSSSSSSASLDFASNYLVLQFAPFFSAGVCHREEELKLLLHESVMVRTKKEDALKDLPLLTRNVWRVMTCRSDDDNSDEDDNVDDTHGDTASSSPSFQRRYQLSGLSKVDAVFRRVVENFVNFAHEEENANFNNRIVLFAHHRAVLDRLQFLLQQYRLDFVRIDGAINPAERNDLLAEFQQQNQQQNQQQQGEIESENQRSASPRFAIVSMTAAGVALSFAAAHVAVFVELPPDASWLRQCEDRLHRLGQRRSVTSILCVGDESAFDARMLTNLFVQEKSTVAVLDVLDATTPSTFEESNTRQIEMNKNNRNGAVSMSRKRSKYFAAARRDDHDDDDDDDDDDDEENVLNSNSGILFQVSSLTSRVHFIREFSDKQSFFSATLDELFTANQIQQQKQQQPDGCDQTTTTAVSAGELKQAIDFVALSKRHIKARFRRNSRLLPPMSLAQLQSAVAAANFGFVSPVALLGSFQLFNSSAVSSSSSLSSLELLAASSLSPREAVFERYKSMRLSDEERARWTTTTTTTTTASATPASSSSSLPGDNVSIVERFIVTMRARTDNKTLISVVENRKSKQQHQQLQQQEEDHDASLLRIFDLFVEVEFSSKNDFSISLHCLHCRRTLNSSSNAARQQIVELIADRSSDSEERNDNNVVIDATRISGAEFSCFCDGACRANWFMQRSAHHHSNNNTSGGGVVASSRLRSAAVKLEQGVCSRCGVDTQALLSKLQRVAGATVAEQQERRMHVLKEDFPALFSVAGGAAVARRLCAKPTAGLLWQCDHIVPVCAGGGAASMDGGNLETLCTACHLAKSALERSGAFAARRARNEEE